MAGQDSTVAQQAGRTKAVPRQAVRAMERPTTATEEGVV
jgi:hypothetical protein